MKGSIRRRSKDSWEISIDLGRDAEGNRRRKFLNVKGKKADAERKLREILSTLDKGLPLDMSKETLGTYLINWHESYAVPNTRPRTADRYMTDIKNHLIPHMGDVLLTKLTSSHIQTTEAKMLSSGLSKRSVLHAHRVLSQALKHAVEKGDFNLLAQPVALSRVERHDNGNHRLKRAIGGGNGYCGIHRPVPFGAWWPISGASCAYYTFVGRHRGPGII